MYPLFLLNLQDGRYLPDNWKEQFDRVLVDAPCSGLGILQKEIRYALA